jgi:hypothetical protein
MVNGDRVEAPLAARLPDAAVVCERVSDGAAYPVIRS